MNLSIVIWIAQLAGGYDAAGELLSFDAPRAPIEQQLGERLVQWKLPAAEMRDIRVQVDRLAKEVRARQWSDEAIDHMIHQLHMSVLEAGIPARFDAEVFALSELSSAEKRVARMALMRYCRALTTGRLDDETIIRLERMVMQPGAPQLRNDLSTVEVHAFVQALDEVADQAGIARTVAAVDASEQFTAAVDVALQATP